MFRLFDKKSSIPEVAAFLGVHWRREHRLVSIISLCMIAATVADLFLPVFSGRLVDAVTLRHAARAEALGLALRSIAAMAGLGSLLVAARYAAFQQLSRLTVRVMAQMGGDAFWRVQRLSTDWQANSFAGAVVRRITRGMWAADLMNDTVLLALLPASVALVGSALVLGAHWPGMGVLVAIMATIYISVSVALSVGFVSPAARLSNQQDSRLGGALADAITCNAVVKAFGAEAREDRRLERVLTKWRARTYRTWIHGTRSGIAQLALLLCLRIAILLYALLLWWRGRATPGDIAFVLTSYFIVHGYLRDVGQHVANLQRSINEMEEMVRLEQEPLGVENRPHAQPLLVRRGAIAFERVTFRYAGHTAPLFRDFSMRIRGGERVGLVGYSGSGKSTFVKLLHRLYDLEGGVISIDGQDIAGVTLASLRAQLALVAQEPILFHRSLAENIAYGRPDASLREIQAAAVLANAHGFIERQSRGYSTLVGERGVKLSGGERQRIALARAFLADAPVLILDEATSSLDAESEAAIQQAMSRLLEGRTAIVIAHRLSTVRMLDRIVVFEDGRLLEEGPHDMLMRQQGGTYRRLFEKQMMGLMDEGKPEAMSLA